MNICMTNTAKIDVLIGYAESYSYLLGYPKITEEYLPQLL